MSNETSAKDHQNAGRDTVAELIADRLGALTTSERRVARALTADYPSAGLGTVAELAQVSGVSGPTVLRFAVAIGFTGFAALQAALKNELRLRTEGPLGRVDWEPVTGSQLELLVTRAETMTASAMRSLRAVPPEDLDAAIALLADPSRPVYLSGGRYSSILAKHLAANLETVRSKVRFLADPFGADIGSLVGLGVRDTYVLVDFHRYQRDAVDIAKLARRKGATIILITDERLSPAAIEAQVVLPINVSALSPFYTLAGGIMLVELLMVPVLQGLGEKGRERMAKWDALRSRELVATPDQDADPSP